MAESDHKPVPSGESAENGTATPPAEKKLSGAELKKLKQQEKAAKRAAQKSSQGAREPSQPQKEQPKQHQKSHTGRDAPSNSRSAQDKQPQTSKSHQHASKPRRTSETKAQAPAVQPPAKQVRLFSHLYGQPRRHGIAGAKDVHPAVLALGLQMSSYEVCGSNARCVAMLLAFKSVIQSYTTPPGTSLARHLIPHHLSPQISYLSSCRPISTSMGNAIRWLKELIVKIDPAVPESDAKTSLITSIDLFIRERITAADTLIAESAAQKIVDGDVLLTFAKSSIVKKTLLDAHKSGTHFRTVVVDSKPLFEGKRLAGELADQGLDVQYSLISAASHAMADATKVFLGAHAMMGNGRLYSRIGTAVIAMLAHHRDVPVIVCCESLKFTEKVALDCVVANEVSPAEELLPRTPEREILVKKARETENLQLLNAMFDVTPSEYVKMVVTEYGSLPPSSVPAVLRNLGTI